MPMHKIGKLILVFAGMLGVAAGSFYAGRVSISGTTGPEIIDLERNENGSSYNFISPLLECESPQPPKYNRIQRAEVAVNSLVDWAREHGQISSASVYFRDLNNGPWFGLNEKDPFLPASLLKIPLMMTYLELAQLDPSRLDRKIQFDASIEGPGVRQNFVYEDPLKVGEAYSVKELIEKMITTSDNSAMTLLVDAQEKVSLESLQKVYRDLGILSPGTMRNYEIDAVTYSRFLRVLYNATYLSRPMSDYALELLSRAYFAEGLVAGLPQGVRVSHKFGERTHPVTGERHLHDCGIVYSPSRPYLLCVMTRGKDFKQLASVISGVSRAVYEEIELGGVSAGN